MRKFKLYLISTLLSFVIFSFGCQADRKKTNSILTPSNPFQALIDSLVQFNDSVRGIILHVESPDLNISWTGTSGTSNQPYRIASITKTYVATAILLLSENEKLSLNDSIGKYMSENHLRLLQKDGYKIGKINIRHLLNHTSGIFDYGTSDLYFNLINEDPKHRWTRTAQLEGAIQWGDPYGDAGEEFHYSETNYILLGEIIESVTGKSLAFSLRSLIGFEPLNLNSTWMESVESKPDEMPEIVHPYYNGKDFFNTDPSIDLYGGGGLVSTASDVACFFQSLFEGRIYKKASTLDTMLIKTQFPDGSKPTQDYRLGIQVAQVDGMQIYYHTGIWGSLGAYIPELNTSIAVNFTTKYDPEILIRCISITKRFKKKIN